MRRKGFNIIKKGLILSVLVLGTVFMSGLIWIRWGSLSFLEKKFSLILNSPVRISSIKTNFIDTFSLLNVRVDNKSRFQAESIQVKFYPLRLMNPVRDRRYPLEIILNAASGELDLRDRRSPGPSLSPFAPRENRG